MDPSATAARPNCMTTPPAGMFPTDRHGLIYRSAAIDVGHTDNDLQRACRRGELTRLARGVFAYAMERTPEELHRLTAIASIVDGAFAAPLSHQTAAVLHGLPPALASIRRSSLAATRPAGSGPAGKRTSGRQQQPGTERYSTSRKEPAQRGAVSGSPTLANHAVRSPGTAGAPRRVRWRGRRWGPGSPGSRTRAPSAARTFRPGRTCLPASAG